MVSTVASSNEFPDPGALLRRYRAARWVFRDRWCGHQSYYRYIRHNPRRAVVDERTELVIEAFPRSASTFTVVAFQSAQTRPVRLAHHLHAPVQAVVGARLGVPMLFLVRHPRDAAISVTFRSPFLPLRSALEAYIRFYTRVLPLAEAMVVATFEQVTTELDVVTARVNDRFGTDFDRFEHTPEHVQACFALIEERSVRPPWADSIQAYVSGWISAEEFSRVDRGTPTIARVPEGRVARPSGERRELKAAAEALYRSPELADLRLRAERVHAEFAAHAAPP